MFAAEGASVVALDRAPEVEATVAAILAAGGRAIALVKDSSAKETSRAQSRPRSNNSAVSMSAYANAGISGGLVPFFEETAERWAQILQINLIGTFLAAKHAALTMRAAARLDHLHGLGRRHAFGAGGMPYSASKAGVISLVQTAPINSPAPACASTRSARTHRDRHDPPIFEQARAPRQRTPNRPAQSLAPRGAPGEIAQMALFLASDAASYVNGQAFAVDGGLSSSLPVVLHRG